MLNNRINLLAFIHNVCPPFLRQYLDRIEASPLGYRLARGAFWSLTGNIMGRGLNLIASVVVARILGKVGFGELGIIQSTVGMFGVFAGFGLGMTATKYVAEYREKDPEKAGRIMMLSELVSIISGSLMALVLILISPWLATNTLSAPHLTGLLRISALLLFLNAINGAQTGALAGFEAFKTIANLNFLAGMFSFPMMVAGVYLAGLKGAVWGLVGSMAINWLLNHIAIRKKAQKAGVPYTFKNCTKEWKIIWDFSFPAFLASAMVGPVNWVCNAMLVNQPNGYAEMGIFNAANQWFNMLLFFPAIISNISVPILSERIGVEDNQSSKKVLLFSAKANGIVVLMLAILGSVLSRTIMQFYGQGFAEGWMTLIIVLLTAFILAIQIPVGNIIIASGKMWIGLVMNLGWATVFVLLTWSFVKSGAPGLAGARLIAYTVHAIWTLGFAYTLIKK